MNLTVAQLAIINDYHREREFAVTECVSPEGHIVPTKYYVSDGRCHGTDIRCANLTVAVRTLRHLQPTEDKVYPFFITNENGWLKDAERSLAVRMIEAA